MTGDPRGDVLDRLAELVGVEEASPSMLACAPVSAAEIRLWCDAIGDRNPIHRDADAATRAGHDGLVAPPAMLQVWTLPPLDADLPPLSLPPADLVDNVVNRAYAILDEFGFTSLIATGMEQEYRRYLRPGDVVSASSTLESVSPRKHTRLGEGHFVTSVLTHRDQTGETVAVMRLHILKFCPVQPSAPPAPPVIDRDNAFFWDGVRTGQLLIQHCGGCGKLRHPPRPACPSCGGLDWDTVAADGRGTVVSFVESPSGAVTALVELTEGVRIVAGLAQPAADVRIGSPVRLEFRPVASDLTLPWFVSDGPAA